MTPGCLLDITSIISPCWTRQGLSSHAFLWHFSSLSRLRDSVTLGLETVGTVYCALHQYNAGPAERVENLTLACARTHQPHWPLGETDRHHKPQTWQIVTWRIQKTGVCCEKLCPHQHFLLKKSGLCKSQKGRKGRGHSNRGTVHWLPGPGSGDQCSLAVYCLDSPHLITE